MNIFSAIIRNPQSVFFATQEKNEKIIFVLRQSFITNIPWLFVSFLSYFIPLTYLIFTSKNTSVLSDFIGYKFEIAFLVTILIFNTAYTIEKFLTWYFNVYIITDRRVIDIDFKPLFYKKVSETTYDRLEDTSFEIKNFFGTIFNYGDVYIQTAGKNREFDFLNVPNPELIQDIISDYLSLHKRT